MRKTCSGRGAASSEALGWKLRGKSRKARCAQWGWLVCVLSFHHCLQGFGNLEEIPLLEGKILLSSLGALENKKGDNIGQWIRVEVLEQCS